MSQTGFDMNAILAQAAGVVAEAEESNSNQFDMKLVYPQDGNLWVKVLFNPASSSVTRKIVRHKTKHGTVPCLGYYGQECPVCKAVQNVKNLTGQDMWQLNATNRGICYAEFVDSDYKYDKPEDKPAVGEVVLLMFPWTIYTGLNKQIAEAGAQVSQLVASNEGFIFKISRWKEKDQIKYSIAPDALKGMRKSKDSEEEFIKMISDLSSLNDRIMPSAITDAIVKNNRDIADKLNAEYVSQNSYSGGQNAGTIGGMANNIAGGMNIPTPPPPPANPLPQIHTDELGNIYHLINNQWVLVQAAPTPPVQTTTPPPTPNTPPPPPPSGGQVNNTSQATGGKPQCFGQHNATSNNCIICPNEVECRSSGK